MQLVSRWTWLGTKHVAWKTTPSEDYLNGFGQYRGRLYFDTESLSILRFFVFSLHLTVLCHNQTLT